MLEARLRSLIKLDSESDDQDVGPINPERIDSDRNNYQYYARHKQERDPEKPFSVYGLPEFRDLDVLRLWVNSNEHMYRTWPPGYTPLKTDLDERDDWRKRVRVDQGRRAGLLAKGGSECE